VDGLVAPRPPPYQTTGALRIGMAASAIDAIDVGQSFVTFHKLASVDCAYVQGVFAVCAAVRLGPGVMCDSQQPLPNRRKF
jgi:hypothetical protein